MAHALSDDQVTNELKKMVAFIKQEAVEKAREISIKADEEFAIEKSKLVRAETLAVDALYERRLKQAELAQQIARSNVTNRMRLRVLAARQGLLDDIFEKTRGQLGKALEREEGYVEVLRDLMLEGVYALNESKVEIRVREKDLGVARKAIEEAKNAYQGSGELEIAIDEKNPLPADSHGGVSLISGSGKISVNNTLEERLKLLESEALPAIRASVFGQNPNRKFYD